MRGTGRKKGMIKWRKLPRYAATYRAMERTARGFDIILNVAALSSSSSSKLTYWPDPMTCASTSQSPVRQVLHALVKRAHRPRWLIDKRGRRRSTIAITLSFRSTATHNHLSTACRHTIVSSTYRLQTGFPATWHIKIGFRFVSKGQESRNLRRDWLHNSPDCLPILLSLSVFTFQFFSFPLFVFGFVR